MQSNPNALKIDYEQLDFKLMISAQNSFEHNAQDELHLVTDY